MAGGVTLGPEKNRGAPLARRPEEQARPVLAGLAVPESQADAGHEAQERDQNDGHEATIDELGSPHEHLLKYPTDPSNRPEEEAG